MFVILLFKYSKGSQVAYYLIGVGNGRHYRAAYILLAELALGASHTLAIKAAEALHLLGSHRLVLEPLREATGKCTPDHRQKGNNQGEKHKESNDSETTARAFHSLLWVPSFLPRAAQEGDFFPVTQAVLLNGRVHSYSVTREGTEEDPGRTSAVRHCISRIPLALKRGESCNGDPKREELLPLDL